MITHEDLEKLGSGSTIPDILITSLIANSNSKIKNFYEFGTWVGGFIILVNSLTNDLKFYASETMEHFKFQELKNTKPLVNWEEIIDLESLDVYIKKTSIDYCHKEINLDMFISNDSMLNSIKVPLDFIHFDCMIDGDKVYNTAKNLIENHMSDHGIFCVDDFMPICGFRTIAISKLVTENKLFPLYLGHNKMFFCKSHEAQWQAAKMLLAYVKTADCKNKFSTLYSSQNFRPLELSFNGTRHTHFRYDPRWK